ncbi:hypothetical protein PG987_003115 [Apiospora arundinis]|uniref:Pro41 protein n=1 Tax=Apiospora arundinis TaxID=335852 RepID=A0ABR2HZ34_9PEZI
MGKLIKSHLARLISLSAASYQAIAALYGFLWPKVFWDFTTKSMDSAVSPIPYLQLANFVSAGAVMAWEWPIHSCAQLRFYVYPQAHAVIFLVAAVPASLLYQGTNAALYYIIAAAFYWWSCYEGEIISPQPWRCTEEESSWA